VSEISDIDKAIVQVSALRVVGALVGPDVRRELDHVIDFAVVELVAARDFLESICATRCHQCRRWIPEGEALHDDGDRGYCQKCFDLREDWAAKRRKGAHPDECPF